MFSEAAYVQHDLFEQQTDTVRKTKNKSDKKNTPFFLKQYEIQIFDAPVEPVFVTWLTPVSNYTQRCFI